MATSFAVLFIGQQLGDEASKRGVSMNSMPAILSANGG
jgi:hypothetical protein